MKNRNLDHSDNWATPPEFYVELDREFGFDFDPCPLNHDLSKWDGLTCKWGKRNFINPPYSRGLKDAFVRRALNVSREGALCVLLLPVSTSTKLFHDVIYPHSAIRFVRGRIAFHGVNTRGDHVTNKKPMHDSMIVIFRGGTR